MNTKTYVCILAGEVYSEGEQVCESDKCYICRAGEWTSRLDDLIFGVGP